jgi:regulator of nucleoside diphosphate kinase
MSATSETVVTNYDHYRLFRLLDRLRNAQPFSSGAYDALEEELDQATIVNQREVPADVVTMNSKVSAVDLDTGQQMQVTVVFPGDASPASGRISVLAPVGLALLGRRVGEEIEWPMPGGTRRLGIAGVLFQPESAGRFDL